METEPVAPQHFQSMSFNPFSQHQFNQQQQQQEHQMLLQQQLLSQQNQQHQQVDEEMEMADDNTCDMKYSENDMNVTNSQPNHLQQNHLQQLNKQHDEQLLQQIHNSQIHNTQTSQQQFNQQKFGRLDNADFVKKDKLLEEDESYDEDDEDYDEEDDLDDYDEHLVQEMMLSAAPEVQNIIKLIISGFSACATETLRYLVEEENLGVNSPIMVGLIDHLKTQETMLIVNCLRTQQYQAQLIKQHQQQILASQLLAGNKQIDPKLIDPKLLAQLAASQPAAAQQQANQPNSQQINQQMSQQINQPASQMPANHLQTQQLKVQHKKTASPNPNSQQSMLQQQQLLSQQQKQAAQSNHSSSNQRLPGSLTNGLPRLQANMNSGLPATGGSLSPAHGPLTSSPINKPFEQLNSINVNNLNHLSNFNSTLHSAFGGSQSTHSNVNSQNSSARNSQSNSPIHTPPLHPPAGFNAAGQPTNPFAAGQASGFGNNGNNGQFTGNPAFFNQTAGVLSSFKQPFNDSGFSE